MTSLTYNIDVFDNGGIEVKKALQLYRQPHDLEINRATSSADLSTTDRVYRGDGNATGVVRDTVINSPRNPNQEPMPEVYRVLPDHQTALECRWIRLWKDLNPMLSTSKFSTLLGNGLAWTNNTGWPGRYNCLTGEGDPTKMPAFHAPIINGGAILKGEEYGGKLYIETLISSNPTPTAQEVLSKPWLWFWGTSIWKTGENKYITRLGIDGRYYPVRVPLITRLPVYLPLSWLDKLPAGFIPPGALWKP